MKWNFFPLNWRIFKMILLNWRKCCWNSKVGNNLDSTATQQFLFCWVDRIFLPSTYYLLLLPSPQTKVLKCWCLYLSKECKKMSTWIHVRSRTPREILNIKILKISKLHLFRCFLFKFKLLDNIERDSNLSLLQLHPYFFTTYP